MAELYIPALQSQTDQNVSLPYTNCTPAAGAMLYDWFFYGDRTTDDVALRKASGVHTSLGMNYAALRIAFQRLFKLDLTYSEWDRSGTKNITWANLREHLAQSGGSAVAGQYRSLRGWTNEKGQAVDRWQPGGDFGHNVFVCDYRPTANGGDGRVLLMDPLGHGGYKGDRIPLEALWAFIFKSGNGADAYVAAAYGFNTARPDGPAPKGPKGPIVFRDPVVTQTWTVRKGAAFTRANGSSGQFIQSVEVTSICEMTVGGVDCRLLDYGDKHEQLLIRRADLSNPGERLVGSPTGIYSKTQVDKMLRDARLEGRKQGIQAAREDLEDLV